MITHISDGFNTFVDDFTRTVNFFRGVGSKERTKGSNVIARDVSRINTTAVREFSACVMAIGVAITFVALPIISSGISVIGLAIGVNLFVFGHDLFTISKNFEHTTTAQFTDERESGNHPEHEQLWKIVESMESETILKFLLSPTAKYWKRDIIELLHGGFLMKSFLENFEENWAERYHKL